jgi:hypothetical protein
MKPNEFRETGHALVDRIGNYLEGVEGRSWFRICPVNFRTRPEHIDELFEILQRECERCSTTSIAGR